MDIGAIIKKARNEKGLTQEAAAEGLGVSRQTISNWERGRSYPDILSVIRMSDLYGVSLDRLLKEEESVKRSYCEYLEESTNTVKSNERRSKLTVALVTLGIWALSVLVFWLVESGFDSMGYGLVIMWAVLPVMFFAVSFIVGCQDWFGYWKWLVPLAFGLMYTLAGQVTTVTAEGMQIRAVIWPDFAKLPIGLIISIAGLALGLLIGKRRRKEAQAADGNAVKESGGNAEMIADAAANDADKEA